MIQMSLEAVEKVVKMEQKSKERRTAAEVEAKQLTADAERNGLALLREVQSQADDDGKKLLQQAEARAEARSAEIRLEAQKSSHTLRSAAESRLDKAAELIVGRVVR